MKKINMGVIGLGAMGQRLIQTVQQFNSENVHILSICDADEELCIQVGENFNIENQSTDYNDLLNNEAINVIYIAVPPKFHERVVLDTVSKGKHILCEKPLANSLEEARSMLEAVEQRTSLHMMNFPLNYQGTMYKMMNLLHEGFVGEIRRIDLVLHFPEWPRSWQRNSWVGKREQGGFILEVGAHWIQFIQKNFGQIDFIQGEVQYPNDLETCENHVKAKMNLQNGLNVYVDGLSTFAGKERVELVIHGTKGSLMIENWGTLKGGKIGHTLEVIPTEDIKVKRLLDQVVAAVNGEDANLYDFTVGYNVQVVLEAFKSPELVKGIDLSKMYN
jgi:predicted dehydrogenase